MEIRHLVLVVPHCFLAFCWDFVKDEVMSFFKEFHSHNRFFRSLNTTFLALIPKNQDVDLKDFRPISLVGGFVQDPCQGTC